MRSGEIAGVIAVAVMAVLVISAFITFVGFFGLSIALIATPCLVFLFVGVVMKVSEWRQGR